MDLNEQATQPQESIVPQIYSDDNGPYCLIPLTQNQFSRIDVIDYPIVSQWKWFAAFDKHTNSFRAQRNLQDPSTAKRRTVMLSRFIMGEPIGFKVDHSDHDTLNNRRYNLRVSTDVQNAQNRRLNRTTGSGLKGVRKKARGGWEARISVNGKKIYLGSFPTSAAAKEAYIRASQEHHREFSCVG